jgi:hypothetical protein
VFCIVDSIVFIHKPGQVDPPTGNFLGDLTNELKPGQHIIEFVSLGRFLFLDFVCTFSETLYLQDRNPTLM